MKTAALALVCLAAACRSVDQEAEVALWREVIDRGDAAHVQDLEPGESLTLGRAFALANRHNESLALQGEAYLEALIDKKRQLAQWLPNISISPIYFGREKSAATGPLGQNDHVDVPARASYDDLNPYGQLASVYRASQTIEERRALLLDVQASLLLDVARAYYQVLRDEKLAAVLANSSSVQDERVRDVEAQNEVGVARPLDVAQARAQAAATRVALVQARSDARNARAALAFLIGAVTVEGALDDRFEVPDEIQVIDAWKAAALRLRQDLVAARALARASLHGVDVAVSQYYPSISVDLSYFLYKESFPADSLYSALLQANLPIFTFGKIHADVRSAWSSFRQAKLNESQVLRRIAQDVETSYETFETTGAKLVELNTQLAAARDAFEQSVDLVQFGKATNLERLVAQDQFLNAELALTSEGFERKFAYLTLERVSGALDLAIDETGARGAADEATDEDRSDVQP